MFKRVREYLVFGAGRPFGVLWAMEKAYFDFRRRFPGRDEHAYLRLVLQSRYPEKDSDQVSVLVSDCNNLEDIIVKAISVDFTPGIASATRMNVLMNMPPCARCGKYRALSTTDYLCYGCRKYPGFSACTHCHLYWDDSPKFCQQCGGKLWRLTDGPGVPMIPLGTASDQSSPAEAGGGGQSSTEAEALTSQEKEELRQFAELAVQSERLEECCTKVWDENLSERRLYRQLRRSDPVAARNMISSHASEETADERLIIDLDIYFDALCNFYLRASTENEARVRNLMESSKRLAGSLHNYARRAAVRLKEAGSSEYLLRALAATSIDGGRSGQEFSYILESLWKDAGLKGLDPAPAFSSVAKMSEPEMRNTLEDFVTRRTERGY